MTTNLNPKYMIAPSLQEVFRDKDTGLPLRSGYVAFYKDQDRTTPNKVIYKLSGSPGAYTYTALPNPCPLTGIGTMSDGAGNDILPYYYPFDADGNIELYYCRVYNSAGVFQWDRQAYPNFTGGSGSGIDFTNYVPNGQFKQHNDVPLIVGSPAGTIASPSTSIAPGGWSFDRPIGSTANQIITFVRSAVYTSDPSTSPRFQLNANIVSPGLGDLFQDIRLKFDDVNKFQSTASPDEPDQVYTFAIEGQSNTGSNVVLTVVLIKNFGTGGSATTETSIGTITLTPATSIQQIEIDFGDNTGKTIGSLGDDYLQIALRISDSAQNFKFTNAVLAPGSVTITTFPTTTDADMRTRGIAGWMPTPAYDGSDLGLPLVLSKTGLAFDHGVVGKIYPDSAISNLEQDNYLLGDGSQYLTSGYGANGAPYSRLASKYVNEFNNHIWGNGLGFVTTRSETIQHLLKMNNNTAGATTSTADGAISTGFTFSDICTGATNTGVKSYWLSELSNQFLLWNNSIGLVSAVNLATSGFSLALIRESSALTAQISFISTIHATTLAGKYFTFQTPGSINHYLWYKVDGAGADPAPGGIGILVNLLSTDGDAVVAHKTMMGLNGFQSSLVICTAGTAITPGSYLTFHTTGGATTSYYAWFEVNGAGADPSTGGFGIKVSILSTDTNDQVAFKLCAAIGGTYFSTPDLRGMGLRGVDISSQWDKGLRWLRPGGGNQLNVGSYELDSFLSHDHDITYEGFDPDFPPVPIGVVPLSTMDVGEGTLRIDFMDTIVGFSGQRETVGYNAAVNFFIKY